MVNNSTTEAYQHRRQSCSNHAVLQRKTNYESSDMMMSRHTRLAHHSADAGAWAVPTVHVKHRHGVVATGTVPLVDTRLASSAFVVEHSNNGRIDAVLTLDAGTGSFAVGCVCPIR